MAEILNSATEESRIRSRWSSDEFALSVSGKVQEARLLARDPEATIAMLEELSRHSFPSVRQAVAENLNTPRKILVNLSDDINGEVRKAAARIPNSD